MSYASTHSISIIHLFSLKKAFSFKIFWIISFVSIISLLVFYIVQINKTVTDSYLLSRYEEQLARITEESKGLEINFSQANSLEKIEALARGLGFEKVNRVHYLQVSEEKVVSK